MLRGVDREPSSEHKSVVLRLTQSILLTFRCIGRQASVINRATKHNVDRHHLE